MKKPIRSQFILAFAVAISLLIAGCSGNSGNALVGKWKITEDGKDSVVTFTKDGKVLTDEGGKPQNGEYSLSASNTLTMKISNPDPSKGGKESISIEFAVSFVTPDEMTLTPKSADGNPVPAGVPVAKFTRVSK